ncbi:MAG: dihydroneopterin triphosphate diphosphatase [Betaproteobacteria bacterium TMED41]|nr:MAG: dihydroneopterin triphosphate diphosphatase [Betaproteobacteria bacterium TMED41]
MKKKIPKSVLVVVHDKDLNILLLERADRDNFWQSITGSVDYLEEDLFEAAQRELREETGIIAGSHDWINWNFSREFKIFPQWKFKYEDNVEFNTEHIFSVCVESQNKITLSPREHVNFKWLFWREAAEKCFSWTNVLAIKELPVRFQKEKI